jgi:hypothetical protein
MRILGWALGKNRAIKKNNTLIQLSISVLENVLLFCLWAGLGQILENKFILLH